MPKRKYPSVHFKDIFRSVIECNESKDEHTLSFKTYTNTSLNGYDICFDKQTTINVITNTVRLHMKYDDDFTIDFTFPLAYKVRKCILDRSHIVIDNNSLTFILR